jgi:hypothetical protein
MFRKLGIFPYSGERTETPTLQCPLERVNQTMAQWLRLALSKAPTIKGASLRSPEEGNRFSFRNVTFSSYLEFRTMDRFRNPVILTMVRTLKNLEVRFSINVQSATTTQYLQLVVIREVTVSNLGMKWRCVCTLRYSLRASCNFLIFITITILDIMHSPVLYLQHDVSENGFCVRLQV